MENPPNLEDVKLTETSETFPSTYWLTYLNASPGYTYIVVPRGGTLWVYYSNVPPARQIYVWHQVGSPTPINPGENTIAVGPGDMIVYQLANPGSDAITLGYQML